KSLEYHTPTHSEGDDEHPFVSLPLLGVGRHVLLSATEVREPHDSQAPMSAWRPGSVVAGRSTQDGRHLAFGHSLLDAFARLHGDPARTGPKDWGHGTDHQEHERQRHPEKFAHELDLFRGEPCDGHSAVAHRFLTSSRRLSRHRSTSARPG